MRIKLVLLTAFLILINLSSFAQLENPCGGTGDPDDPTTCPLDSWVLILAITALIFTAFHLYRRQQVSKPV